MNLANLSDVKTFLEITKDDHDALLTSLLVNISERVELYLNRWLEKKERTEYFRTGKSKHFLKAYPIDLSSPITVNWGGSLQTKDSDYYVWEDLGIVEFAFQTTRVPSPKGVDITCTGGYASVSDLPSPIQFAVVLQTAFVFKRRADLGLQSITLPNGGISVNNPTKLLTEVEDILRSYRNFPKEK